MFLFRVGKVICDPMKSFLCNMIGNFYYIIFSKINHSHLFVATTLMVGFFLL